jgi:FdhE protein
MAYVRTPHPTRQECLASAERRWTAVAEARPDLQPAISLQRRLIGLIVELADRIDHPRQGLSGWTLAPEALAAKLARGLPALAGELVPLPVAILTAPLLDLCAALAAGGAADAALHIRSSIESGAINPGSLLAASFSRDQRSIRCGAIERGLAPDLLWLVAELAVSPLVHALQQSLFAAAAVDPAARGTLQAWDRGYCPACGSWPALAEVIGGRRILRCSFCAAAWTPDTYACIYCGESGEAFATAAPDEERKNRRVEACGSCTGYLKAVDVDELSPFPLLAIGDLATTDLDVAAMEKGYGRPPIKEFAELQDCRIAGLQD